jgi:hypothetical protein
MYKKIKGFLYNNSGNIATVSGIVAMGCAGYLFWSIGSQFTTPTFGLYATAKELAKPLTNIQKIIMAIFLTNVSICAYAGEKWKAKYNTSNQDAKLDSVAVEPTAHVETGKLGEVKLLHEELRPLLNHYLNTSSRNNTVTTDNISGYSSITESRPRLGW